MADDVSIEGSLLAAAQARVGRREHDILQQAAVLSLSFTQLWAAQCNCAWQIHLPSEQGPGGRQSLMCDLCLFVVIKSAECPFQSNATQQLIAVLSQTQQPALH